MMKTHMVAIPELKLYGNIHCSSKSEDKKLDVKQYFIMPRLATNLEDYFHRMKCHIPEASIYSLGIKILALLECVHETGIVYNDLKLDNLMLGFTDRLPNSS